MSRSFGGTSFTRRSPMKMSPPLASSSPAINRRAVVFPHPEGPTSTVNCLSGISSVMSFTAVTAPNFLVTPCSCTLATSYPPCSPDGAGLHSTAFDPSPRGPPIRRSPLVWHQGTARSSRLRQTALQLIDHGDRIGIDPALHCHAPTDKIADQDRREQSRQLPFPDGAHLVDPSRPREREFPRDRHTPRQPVRLDRIPEDDDVQHCGQRGIQPPADGLIVIELGKGVPHRCGLAILVKLVFPAFRGGLEKGNATVDYGDAPAQRLPEPPRGALGAVRSVV